MLFVCPAMAVPPVATVYHRYCPGVPPAAVRVIELVPQEELLVVVGAMGNVRMLAVTALRVPSQPPLLIRT